MGGGVSKKEEADEVSVNSAKDDDVYSQAETSLADDATLWNAGGVPSRMKLHNVLDLHIHLTAKDVQRNETVPFIRRGRPDIKQLFLDMKAEAIAQGEKRVAVCVCAPQKLSELC